MDPLEENSMIRIFLPIDIDRSEEIVSTVLKTRMGFHKTRVRHKLEKRSPPSCTGTLVRHIDIINRCPAYETWKKRSTTHQKKLCPTLLEFNVRSNETRTGQ